MTFAIPVLTIRVTSAFDFTVVPAAGFWDIIMPAACVESFLSCFLNWKEFEDVLEATTSL